MARPAKFLVATRVGCQCARRGAHGLVMPWLILTSFAWLSCFWVTAEASEPARGLYPVSVEFCAALTDDLAAATHSYVSTRQQRSRLAEGWSSSNRINETAIAEVDLRLRTERERVERLLAIEARVSCPRR